MARTRTKGADLPAGISRRHARSCPAIKSDDLDACRCRPAYQATAGPRRARVTKTWPTLSAAKSWKRDVDRAADEGTLVRGQAPTLADAFETWVAGAHAGIILARGDKRYRRSTLRGYERCMEAEVLPVFGGRPVNAIERAELAGLVGELGKRGLSASTVRNIVVPLRALYRHALYLDQVTVNPTVGLKVPSGSGRRLNFLTPEEIEPLLGALEPEDRALWATAVYAGLRRGELMALRWADLDLASGLITVRMNYDPGSKEMGEVKSDAGQDRRIPICAALHDHLVLHRQRAGARPTGLVFARGRLGGHCRRGTEESPFADQAVGQRAQKAWTTAALRPVGLHDCRHTFASLMIAATAASGEFNPKTIQELLGHASIQQTYDRYGHLFPGAHEQAVRMLDAFLEDGGHSELSIAVSRLLVVLGDAEPDQALPEVTQLRDRLSSWLAEHPSLPSVTPSCEPDSGHPVSIQRTSGGAGL